MCQGTCLDPCTRRSAQRHVMGQVLALCEWGLVVPGTQSHNMLYAAWSGSCPSDCAWGIAGSIFRKHSARHKKDSVFTLMYRRLDITQALCWALPCRCLVSTHGMVRTPCLLRCGWCPTPSGQASGTCTLDATGAIAAWCGLCSSTASYIMLTADLVTSNY